MKFESKKLVDLLKATRATSKNSALPILENVKIDVCNGFAVCSVTDLEFTVTCEIECTGSGIFLIDRTILLDYLLKTKAKDVSIMVRDEPYVLINGLQFQDYKFKDEFPLCPELEKPVTLNYSALLNYELKEAIKFVGDDDLRPVTSGVYLSNENGEHRIASTNCHVLYKAMLGASDDAEYGIILSNPDKIVKVINTFKAMNENVLVSFDSHNAELVYNDFKIQTRLVDGKYPNIDAVIPQKNTKFLTFDKTNFLNTLEVVTVAASKSTRQTILELSTEKTTMYCSDIDNSMLLRSEFIGSFEGDAIEIGFNFHFMRMCISPVIGSEVVCEMSAPNRALLIRSGHRLMLCMPVMIKETTSEYVESEKAETE